MPAVVLLSLTLTGHVMYVSTCIVTSGVAEPTWCYTVCLSFAVFCWALAAVASVTTRECNSATAALATAARIDTCEP